NQNPNKIVNNLVLELHIPDFETVREFYSLFGFREMCYDPTSGGGSDLGYMILKRDDSIGNTSINFYGDKDEISQHKYFANFPQNTPRGYEVEIVIPVSDVRGLWEEVKDKIPEKQITQPLIIKRWNKWDFRIVDPFGFYVRFTELVDWTQ
ncbi:MAG: hypothetical protein RI945_252, partial [Candidatus Parcubacteria bacterium]